MSKPIGQPPGSGGRQHGTRPSPARKPRWPRSHPVWSTLIGSGIILIVIIIAATNNPTTIHNTAADIPTHSPATAMARGSALPCRAQASSNQPRDHTSVTINVHTAAKVKVTATSRGAPLRNKTITGSSNAQGIWRFRFRIGALTPGTRVVVTVHVSRPSASGTCQASFRPRATAVSAAPAPATQPAASPSPAPAATQPATTPTTAASCYPISDEGTCYEPGEYCRDDDHGASGVAGDGENIVCEDNDGWRWEPV
jgi:hypothetical protein